jgi:hypothetical protein
MRLTDEELRDVLARAEELERTTRHGEAWNAEIAAVIEAAEEVGLSRQAVERALAERLNLPAAPPAAGALTWARSADGKFYVAEVMSTAETGIRVRFLGGGEQLLPPDALRPCTFIPGERVVCQWPMWGQWSCTVISYDAAKQRVRLSDGWGSTRTFPVSEVWLPPAKSHPLSVRRRMAVMLLGAGVLTGAVIGAIITVLLMD